jgi:hypothetical protein
MLWNIVTNLSLHTQNAEFDVTSRASGVLIPVRSFEQLVDPMHDPFVLVLSVQHLYWYPHVQGGTWLADFYLHYMRVDGG